MSDEVYDAGGVNDHLSAVYENKEDLPPGVAQPVKFPEFPDTLTPREQALQAEIDALKNPGAPTPKTREQQLEEELAALKASQETQPELPVNDGSQPVGAALYKGA